MVQRSSFRIVEEIETDGGLIQLVESPDGSYRLRKMIAAPGGYETSLSEPVHSDTSVLAEAREYFPDHLPFGAVPVDST